MPTLVFFPWLHVSGPVQLDRFNLIPYERKGPWPEDVHRILSGYELAPGRPIESATIVELDPVVGGELGESDVDDVFSLRRALSFSGLRHRRFFDHDGYINDHTFNCVVQNYRPARKGVGVIARRRDGNAQKLWPTGWRVRCPDHVSTGRSLRIDINLVSALLKAMEASDGLRDAVELFNLANTDSSDVRPHTELLLSVAAAQRMLGVEKKSNVHDLAMRFAEALKDIEPECVLSECRRQITPSRKAKTLRQLWFEDFYTSRGVVAHGRPNGPPKALWTVPEHLLLASYIIPRLALVRLTDDGFYSITEHDRAEIADFDHLLCQSNLFGPPDAQDDPSPEEFDPASGPWAWTETLYAAATQRHSRKRDPALERAIEELFATISAKAIARATEDEPSDNR